MLPFCHIALKAKKPVSREKYPDFLRTWGDHIKARRLDLKLTKRELSLKFNVSNITIYLWEKNKVKPSLAQIPKIIEFLGHDPFEAVFENLADKINAYRRLHGLPQNKLAKLLKIDQSSVGNWERSENISIKRNKEKILSFLNSNHSAD